MTERELKNLYLETEHGTFTPIYEYEHYDQETDSYTGFKVVKTAEEVYNEWLNNKDKPPIVEPDKLEVLEVENRLLKARVDATENALLELMTKYSSN